MDRFLLKEVLDYPSLDDEVSVLDRVDDGTLTHAPRGDRRGRRDGHPAAPGRDRAGLRRRRRQALHRRHRARHPPRSRQRSAPSSAGTSRPAPARAGPSRSSRSRGPWRCSAAARTSCPRTSRSCGTACCGTGCTSPSRRWPTGSSPRSSSTRSSPPSRPPSRQDRPMPGHVPRIKARLALQAHRRVRGLLEGEYAAVQTGRGMEFNDLREYVRGDDVKDLDWKASARTGEMLVKRFVAVRRHTVLLVVSTGRSMAAANALHVSKRDLAVEVAGLVGWLGGAPGRPRRHRLRRCRRPARPAREDRRAAPRALPGRGARRDHSGRRAGRPRRAAPVRRPHGAAPRHRAGRVRRDGGLAGADRGAAPAGGPARGADGDRRRHRPGGRPGGGARRRSTSTPGARCPRGCAATGGCSTSSAPPA